jgi:hypothetical protein
MNNELSDREMGGIEGGAETSVKAPPSLTVVSTAAM